MTRTILNPKAPKRQQYVLTASATGTPIVEPAVQSRGTYYAIGAVCFLYSNFNTFPAEAKANLKKALGEDTCKAMLRETLGR